MDSQVPYGIQAWAAAYLSVLPDSFGAMGLPVYETATTQILGFGSCAVCFEVGDDAVWQRCNKTPVSSYNAAVITRRRYEKNHGGPETLRRIFAGYAGL